MNGKKCVIIGMASGRSYLLTLDNFRQIYPVLVNANSGQKLKKTKNDLITTVVVQCCPCPAAVRSPENGESDAQTGEK